MNEYFLFSRPSFLSGVSRVMDLGATLNEYNYMISPSEADACATRSDWSVVGEDISFAMEKHENELSPHGKEED